MALWGLCTHCQVWWSRDHGGRHGGCTEETSKWLQWEPRGPMHPAAQEPSTAWETGRALEAVRKSWFQLYLCQVILERNSNLSWEPNSFLSSRNFIFPSLHWIPAPSWDWDDPRAHSLSWGHHSSLRFPDAQSSREMLVLSFSLMHGPPSAFQSMLLHAFPTLYHLELGHLFSEPVSPPWAHQALGWVIPVWPTSWNKFIVMQGQDTVF